MRALIPAQRTPQPLNTDALIAGPEPYLHLLRPLVESSEHSNYIVSGTVGEFMAEGVNHQIPRFIFLGDKGGGDTIRLAVFAGLTGDEPETIEGVVAFLLDLERRPSLAKNYHIYVYPIANPAAFASGARSSHSASSFARQFWHRSSAPEIYYLERELGVIQFHGVVSIRGQSESQEFYARMSRPALEDSVAKPAVHAANLWLPPRGAALQTVRRESTPMFLSVTDELKSPPFEIILEPPRQVSRHAQINSVSAALSSILVAYREASAFGLNI